MTATDYPAEWPEVATKVKDDAAWRCVRCHHRNESPKQHAYCDHFCDLSRHQEVAGGVEVEYGRFTSLKVYYKAPQKQRVLTVHHLDGDKQNLKWWNLAALCQVCHLIIQAKVHMIRPWAMFEHSEWFKPYVAGFYAWRYLHEDLIRGQVEERMEELLALEKFL